MIMRLWLVTNRDIHVALTVVQAKHSSVVEAYTFRNSEPATIRSMIIILKHKNKQGCQYLQISTAELVQNDTAFEDVQGMYSWNECHVSHRDGKKPESGKKEEG